MSIRTLFSKTLDQFEYMKKVLEESLNYISEKAKEQNSLYNINCEELSYFIERYESLIEFGKRCEKSCPNFSFDEYIKSGKHLRASEDSDFLAEDIYFGLIKEKKNIEVKIRELAQNIFGETVASLEVIKIKEHLYKNWKFK